MCADLHGLSSAGLEGSAPELFAAKNRLQDHLQPAYQYFRLRERLGVQAWALVGPHKALLSTIPFNAGHFKCVQDLQTRATDREGGMCHKRSI